MTNIDPKLAKQLATAGKDEVIDAVFLLKCDIQPDPLARMDKANRILQLAKRTEAIRKALGTTMELLRHAGLVVRGGETGRAVVVQGTPAQISTGLDVPGVESALFNHSMDV